MDIEPTPVTDEMRAKIRAAWAEIDPERIRIIAAMTPAERVQKGFELSDAWAREGAQQIQREQPELSDLEAKRLFLERYYRENPEPVLPLHLTRAAAQPDSIEPTAQDETGE